MTSDNVSLAGARALVTGGTTGIGRAIAAMLVREGARVFVCGRDADRLAEALAAMRADGEADGVALDLAAPGAAARFVHDGAERLGGLDLLVLNAAVGARGLGETDPGWLDHAIAVDFAHYLQGARAALDRFGEHGHLVLIGSMSAHALVPGSSVYAGIKYGLQGFAQALRRELGPRGVRVSLVEPGLTGTELISEPPAAQQAMIAAETMLMAEDVADGVRYLLTQPRRVVVQQLCIVPRARGEE